jgi:hypothetical protein
MSAKLGIPDSLRLYWCCVHKSKRFENTHCAPLPPPTMQTQAAAPAPPQDDIFPGHPNVPMWIRIMQARDSLEH